MKIDNTFCLDVESTHDLDPSSTAVAIFGS